MSRARPWPDFGPLCLAETTRVRVRFQEVDSLRVVWHGHYLAYFEEGRVAFGARYGFSYEDILAAGYVAPIVRVEMNHLRPARLQQMLVVTTRLHVDPGAAVHFGYSIADEDGRVLTRGRTVQVFTTLGGELVLTRPPFYEAFLARWAASLVSA